MHQLSNRKVTTAGQYHSSTRKRAYMLENFRRARYFTKFFQDNTKRGIQQYTWLKENYWPADDFVDLFRRVYPEGNYLTPYLFKHFIVYQFEWAHSDDVDSLKKLYEIILEPDFRRQDKANLIDWLKPMVDGVKSRITEEEKILAVQFNEQSNRYEITHIETKLGERYKVLFTGTETECRNFVSSESSYQSGWATGTGKSQDSNGAPQHALSKPSMVVTGSTSMNEAEIQATAAKKAKDTAEILGGAKGMDEITVGRNFQEAQVTSKLSYESVEIEKPDGANLITQEDIDTFGSDLVDLMGRVYREISISTSLGTSPSSHVGEEDEEAFGLDLIGLITVMAYISVNKASENPTILKGLEQFINVETFGRDLIDLIRRKLLDEIAADSSAK